LRSYSVCLFGAASFLLAGSSLSSCKQEMFLIKRSLERTLPSPTVNPLMDNHMPLVSQATPTRNRSLMHSKERTIHPLRPMVARPTTLTLNLSTRMFQAVIFQNLSSQLHHLKYTQFDSGASCFLSSCATFAPFYSQYALLYHAQS
jgi:hypothetical protein